MPVFYRPTTYNGVTKSQMWMSIVGDAHDIHCGCDKPFAHLLDNIFPEGHQDRNLTIDAIIARDLQCHFGGEEETDDGLAAGTSAATLKEDIKEEGFQEDIGVEDLLAAAANAEQR